VEYLVIYGVGFCDDSGPVEAALFEVAGLKPAFVPCLHGHMMAEVQIDGRYRFFDVDEPLFLGLAEPLAS